MNGRYNKCYVYFHFTVIRPHSSVYLRFHEGAQITEVQSKTATWIHIQVHDLGHKVRFLVRYIRRYVCLAILDMWHYVNMANVSI